jgi:hypothetical protein
MHAARGCDVETEMENCIKRVVFELNCSDQAAAFGARARIPALVDDVVVPALDQVLSSFAPEGRTCQIDRIEIDLGRLNLDNFDAAHLRETITAGLGRGLRSEDSAAESATASIAETISYFLTTGTLPWHAAGRSLAVLEAMARALEPTQAERLVERLRPLLRGSPQSLRFAIQFSEAFVAWLLARLQAMTGNQRRSLARSLPRDLSFRQQLAILLLAAARLSPGATHSLLRMQIKQLAGVSSPPERSGKILVSAR